MARPAEDGEDLESFVLPVVAWEWLAAAGPGG